MTGSESSPRPEVAVAFPVERDIPEWERRFAGGEVPSPWPYGLDALGQHAAVMPLSLAEPSFLVRAFHRVVGAVPPRRAADGRAVTITWDENAARRMLLSRHPGERYSGLIWLTDRLSRLTDAQRSRTIALLRRLDGVFVNSTGQLNAARELLGGDGPRVEFVPFGVDTSFFPARPYPEKPMLLSVGGDRDRDAATLFRTLERVASERPDVEIIAQSGSTQSPPSGVTVVPRVSHRELAALYARAAVVVVATRPNLHASGLTVSLESMSSARPVVITRTPGLDHYIDDGMTGFFADVGDADALAERALTLLNDPTRAELMGTRGRDRVVGHFTTRHLADGLADFMRLAR